MDFGEHSWAHVCWPLTCSGGEGSVPALGVQVGGRSWTTAQSWPPSCGRPGASRLPVLTGGGVVWGYSLRTDVAPTASGLWPKGWASSSLNPAAWVWLSLSLQHCRLKTNFQILYLGLLSIGSSMNLFRKGPTFSIYVFTKVTHLWLKTQSRRKQNER